MKGTIALTGHAIVATLVSAYRVLISINRFIGQHLVGVIRSSVWAIALSGSTLITSL